MTINKQCDSKVMQLMTEIKDYAAANKITHQSISDKTGIDRALITKILSGRHNGNINTVIKIVIALNLDFFIIKQ